MTKRNLLLTPLLLGVIGLCAGCSTNDNPIDPDQMSKIRKSEASARANFNPSTTPPPRGSGQ